MFLKASYIPRIANYTLLLHTYVFIALGIRYKPENVLYMYYFFYASKKANTTTTINDSFFKKFLFSCSLFLSSRRRIGRGRHATKSATTGLTPTLLITAPSFTPVRTAEPLTSPSGRPTGTQLALHPPSIPTLAPGFSPPRPGSSSTTRWTTSPRRGLRTPTAWSRRPPTSSRPAAGPFPP